MFLFHIQITTTVCSCVHTFFIKYPELILIHVVKYYSYTLFEIFPCRNIQIKFRSIDMLQINKCSFPYNQLISVAKGKKATLGFISSEDSWVSIFPQISEEKNLSSKNGGRLDFVKGKVNFHNNIKLPNR